MPFLALADLDVLPFTLVSPDDQSMGQNQPFQWKTSNDNFKGGHTGHFRIQIAEDDTFVSIVVEAVSWISAANFEYESSPGSWNSLPALGLAETDFGKDVRYNSSISVLEDYWWRVRPEQVY
jgi:hypothetical protein